MFLRLRRLIQRVGRDAVVLWYACRDPKTPLPVKLLALGIASYLIYPIDLMPDLFPVLGWIDDVTLVGLAVPAVLKMVPGATADQARLATGRLLSRWRFWRVDS